MQVQIIRIRILERTTMYVCLCNGHRDRELKDLAARGVSCVHDAYRRLGGEPVCGRCLDFAQDLIDGARTAAMATRCPGREAPAAAPASAGIGHPDAFVPAEPAR